MGYVKKQLSIRKSEIFDANSSGLVRVVVRFFFFLLIFLNVDREATAQDHIPVDVGTVDTVFYNEQSRGYWFAAPSCFIISGWLQIFFILEEERTSVKIRLKEFIASEY